MRQIQTKFFGTKEIDEEQIIRFPIGLPGFENSHNFILLRVEDSVFSCLQAVDKVETAFVLISPFEICSDYHFNLDEDTINRLEINAPGEVEVLSIVVIPNGKMNEATANLQAPIVINKNKMLGQQTILADTDYPLRLPIWESKNLVAK